MTHYADYVAKNEVRRECEKRNARISRFHVMRWKPLWEPSKGGWFPALRPAPAAKR